MGASYYGKDQELKPEAEGYADSSEAFLRQAYSHFGKAKELAPGAWGKSCDDNIVSMFGRHFNRGVIATKKGAHAEAAIEYRLASIADPENYQGYYAHAAAILPLANEAKADKEKFTEIDRCSAQGSRQGSRAQAGREGSPHLDLHDQGRGALPERRHQGRAGSRIRKAIELDPENYELMATMGDRFYNAGDYENAANYFEQSLAIQDRLNLIEASDTDTYVALGTSYVKLNKRPEAIGAFEKALKISPNDAPLMYNVMVSYYKSGEAAEKDGKMDEAKANCSKCISIGNDVIRIDSTKPEYWQVRGYCKRIMGDTAGAASDLKKFNELRAASAK